MPWNISSSFLRVGGESRGCGLLRSGWLALGGGWTLQYPLARHWQDLGYMILYITGRPDMQKQRVVSWLSQHNFPQGMIFFSDGLVHDPLRQKAIFLRNLMQEVGVRQGRGFHRGGVSPRRPPPRPRLLPQPRGSPSFTAHAPIVQADAQLAKHIHVHLIGPFTAQRGVYLLRLH